MNKFNILYILALSFSSLAQNDNKQCTIDKDCTTFVEGCCESQHKIIAIPKKDAFLKLIKKFEECKMQRKNADDLCKDEPIKLLSKERHFYIATCKDNQCVMK